MSIALVSGSGTASSRSERLLHCARTRLGREGEHTSWVAIRDLPADDLWRGQSSEARVQRALRAVRDSSATIIASPVVNASCTGMLKAFLDLIPEGGLENKTVLVLSTADSTAHTASLEHALRPVLTSLGGTDVIPGVFAVDTQVLWWPDVGLHLDRTIDERLNAALSMLLRRVRQTAAQIDLARNTAALPFSQLRYSV